MKLTCGRWWWEDELSNKYYPGIFLKASLCFQTASSDDLSDSFVVCHIKFRKDGNYYSNALIKLGLCLTITMKLKPIGEDQASPRHKVISLFVIKKKILLMSVALVIDASRQTKK